MITAELKLTCQHPTTQFFTGRMLFLQPNQQRQSTEGHKWNKVAKQKTTESLFLNDAALMVCEGST